MATNNNHLVWNSSSFKLAIRQKLAENPLFTDFIFEDSNLTTLLDTFAYMYETMSYYVNSSASEAMFADAAYYENMNRIVKLIGYNPYGYQSCSISANLSTSASLDVVDQRIISKYTSVSTGLVDSRGKPIHYSFIADRYIDVSDIAQSSDTSERLMLINGKWKMYSSILVADGQPFEEFVLSSIVLDSVDKKTINYVSHPYVDVYVRDAATNVITKYTPVSDGGLFTDKSSILTPVDTVFELRIDESKIYTIRFGDGLRGRKLNEGDELIIVYLEGNGPGSELGQQFFNSTAFASSTSGTKFKVGVAGMNTSTFDEITPDNIYQTGDAAFNSIVLTNYEASTKFGEMESVTDIKFNAPSQLRANDRLVTRADIESFVKLTFTNDVYDCVAMNNYEYITKFIRYVFNLDKGITAFRSTITPNNTPSNLLTADLRRLNFKTSDPADSNNVYVWVKYQSYALDPSIIEDAMYSRKSITAEPVVMNGIRRIFVPCYKYNLNQLNANDMSTYDYDPSGYWDACVENWIEIEKHKTALNSSGSIKNSAVIIFNDFFNPAKLPLGGVIDIDGLYKALLAIPGVAKVRTAYRKSTDTNCANTQYFNGLSFATWDQPFVRQILSKTGGNATDGTNPAAITMVQANTHMDSFAYGDIINDGSLVINNRIKVVTDAYSPIGIEY